VSGLSLRVMPRGAIWASMSALRSLSMMYRSPAAVLVLGLNLPLAVHDLGYVNLALHEAVHESARSPEAKARSAECPRAPTSALSHSTVLGTWSAPYSTPRAEHPDPGLGCRFVVPAPRGGRWVAEEQSGSATYPRQCGDTTRCKRWIPLRS